MRDPRNAEPLSLTTSRSVFRRVRHFLEPQSVLHPCNCLSFCLETTNSATAVTSLKTVALSLCASILRWRGRKRPLICRTFRRSSSGLAAPTSVDGEDTACDQMNAQSRLGRGGTRRTRGRTGIKSCSRISEPPNKQASHPSDHGSFLAKTWGGTKMEAGRKERPLGHAWPHQHFRVLVRIKAGAVPLGN